MRGAGIAALFGLIGLAACNRQPASKQARGTAFSSEQTGSGNAATRCGTLATLALPNTTIILAESVAAGTFVPSPDARTLPSPPSAPPVSYAGLPAFCRVVAMVRPVRARAGLRNQV